MELYAHSYRLIGGDYVARPLSIVSQVEKEGRKWARYDDYVQIMHESLNPDPITGKLNWGKVQDLDFVLIRFTDPEKCLVIPDLGSRSFPLVQEGYSDTIILAQVVQISQYSRSVVIDLAAHEDCWLSFQLIYDFRQEESVGFRCAVGPSVPFFGRRTLRRVRQV